MEVWGNAVKILENRSVRWRIGPLDLLLTRRPMEWRIAYTYGADPLDSTALIEAPSTIEDLAEGASCQRLGFKHCPEAASLSPMLADRHVIARPESPFLVPPGEQVELYVSTPLWVQVNSIGPGQLLMEIPASRISDTWIGANTREGELGYAVRTRARTSIDDLPTTAVRVITPVKVVNHAADSFLLQRVELPMIRLALFRGNDGRFWTPAVTVERNKEGDLAKFRWESLPFSLVQEPVQISPPRSPVQGNVILRAFDILRT